MKNVFTNIKFKIPLKADLTYEDFFSTTELSHREF